MFPTQKIGSLPFNKCATQADLVTSTTTLYLRLGHKEANTRIIVSQLAAINIHQMKKILSYIHMYGGICFWQGWKKGVYEGVVRDNIAG